jgi:hypothetical protein
MGGYGALDIARLHPGIRRGGHAAALWRTAAALAGDCGS